ncbi:IS5 family transposase [Tetragenococcus koreensis]|uniref:IS5 family transposase n=2 Tax=Tetragenococcus koreensis TaxID=290335 RepID=UPI001F45E0B7|nr:IS5 family transposase [Tetragenococcus koreensis]MCF1627428.1 IS5 family transposase [Tetragenococcus koreensis]MCF1632477.1 IS5 family transposase [Tetragenococcus koreensis]
MYKSQPYIQISFEDFNQPLGLHMNPENRWVKKAERIPWSALEKDYAKNFPNPKGNVAKSLRMALGALLIQKEYHYSDEETVAQIQENPYLQFFVGLPGYQEEAPFEASSMVHFRERLDEVTLIEINEKILAYNQKNDDDSTPPTDGFNSGTLTLDATCAPQNIKYPTDTELLNDVRTHAEKIIDALCEDHQWKKPRIYRQVAQKVYLNIVRRKKKAKKWLRPQIRKMLGFVKRDIKVIQKFLDQGAHLTEQQAIWWVTIQKIYEQQRYMYDNHTHSVQDRVVSFHQPWLRPIVRGKAKASVEFGAKFDMSLDQGIARLEYSSFDAYNESDILVSTIRRYHDRHGYYPERVLADKIYRNRKNLNYCKQRGIRLSGPALGRPKKNEVRDKTTEDQDNADRVAVERGFSQLKGCFGADLITTKRKDTTLLSIALSVLALNLSQLTADFLRQILSSNFKSKQIKNRTVYFSFFSKFTIIQ